MCLNSIVLVCTSTPPQGVENDAESEGAGGLICRASEQV